MSDALHAKPVPLDEQGRIQADLVCVGCGYNLRGLSPDAGCPECGVPVNRSRYGALLKYSHPEWVEQLSSGMNWLVWMIIAVVVGAAVVGIAAAASKATAAPNSVVSSLFGLGPSVVSLIAYWKLTTPDPARREEGLTARQLTRGVAVADFILTLGQLALSSIISQQIIILVTVVSEILGLIQIVAIFTYARQLAERIPDAALVGHTTLVMWGLVISMVASLLMFAIMALSGGASGALSVGASPIGLVARVGGVGSLFFGLWSLLLIAKYRKALNAAAIQARVTWARDMIRPT